MTADPVTTETAATTRLVVTGGGEPTAEQLAAVVVALTPVTAEEGAGRDQPPPWAQAALQEAIGHRPFLSADDLKHGRYKLS